eukprot:36129-Pelagomonas_calceolata.AAC.1
MVVPTRTARFTCLSGRGMAVSLARNHTPPEVRLRQGAESGWVPQPDCMEETNTTVLEGMVGSHIKKLNAAASPGLDERKERKKYVGRGNFPYIN